MALQVRALRAARPFCCHALHRLQPALASRLLPALSTSSVHCLRKRPVGKETFLGINKWYFYQLMPARLMRSFIELWIRKRWKNNRFSTMAEKEKQNIFYRMSQVYALLVWSAVGLGLFVFTRPTSAAQQEEAIRRKEDPLPHEEELAMGGALSFITSLKSPEDLQNSKPLKIYRFKGFSFEGSEDVTLKAKEVAQAMTMGKNESGEPETMKMDFYLRRYNNIPYERRGGPSTAQLKAQFEAEGRNWDIEIDFANRMHSCKTRYNPDGSVGMPIRSRDDFPTLEEVEVVAARTEELELTRADLPAHLQKGRIRRLFEKSDQEGVDEGAQETPDKKELVM